jgi:hypothetical protein
VERDVLSRRGRRCHQGAGDDPSLLQLQRVALLEDQQESTLAPPTSTTPSRSHASGNLRRRQFTSSWRPSGRGCLSSTLSTRPRRPPMRKQGSLRMSSPATSQRHMHAPASPAAMMHLQMREAREGRTMTRQIRHALQPTTSRLGLF